MTIHKKLNHTVGPSFRRILAPSKSPQSLQRENGKKLIQRPKPRFLCTNPVLAVNTLVCIGIHPPVSPPGSVFSKCQPRGKRTRLLHHFPLLDAQSSASAHHRRFLTFECGFKRWPQASLHLSPDSFQKSRSRTDERKGTPLVVNFSAAEEKSGRNKKKISEF